MKLAGDGRALFHDDQLLLLFLMPVERQRGRELFDQRINQLLLVVAQVTPGWQRCQQNTVLGVAVGQAPLQGGAAGRQRRQAARAKMAAFVIAGHIRLTGKFLMVIFVFHVVDAQLKVVKEGQILQAVQHRRETLAERHLHVQTTVGLPQEGEDLVFLLQSGRFFLNALFQHRVALGELCRHGVERLAEHGHLVAPADVRALGKIACGHRAGHCKQLFPRVQQPRAEPDDGEDQQ